MNEKNLKLALPTTESQAKLSIPRDITQEELNIFAKGLNDLLQRLTELNPDLKIPETPAEEAPTDSAAEHVVVAGDEVGGFVTSVKDQREAIAKKAGLFLRNYREKRAFQRTEISEQTGMSYSSVFNLEKGSSVPSLETLARFANVYGCDVKVTFVKNEQFDNNQH